jgi:hypothetical protein
MSNILFDPGREGHLDGTIIESSGDIRVMLVKTAYTFSAAHKFLSDITAGNDNGRSASLGSKTVTNGVFNAAVTSLVATAAVACNALVIFQHTGADGTARVIAYIDTPTAGLPFTPSAGQTVNITWDAGANKIYKL